VIEVLDNSNEVLSDPGKSHIRAVSEEEIQSVATSSKVVSAGRYFTSYVVPTGEETIFSSRQATPFSAIKDGTSNTLLVVEACGTEIIWTKPLDVELSSYELSVNGPGSRNGQSDSLISSWHKGGAQVLLADGSAHFLSDAIDPKILRSLLTKDAGDDAVGW
jgi:prepilin-type processing-associated H-X9-DG protein